MDLLSPRAIPPLILAGALAAAPQARADCKPMEGRYRNSAAGAEADVHATLSNLAAAGERGKLFRHEGGSNPGGLSPTEPIRRGKAVALAASAQLRRSPKGMSLAFFDAQGAPIATSSIEIAQRWACRNGRLERAHEVYAGLGNAVRLDRTEESLERNAAGELVLRKTVTAVDGPTRAPVRQEWRYPAVR